MTVCSANYVAFTRTLFEGLRRHHPDVPLVVAVVDADSREGMSIEGATVVTGRDIFGEDLGYLALKFTASELCCAAKPLLLEYLLETSHYGRFLYLDSDIYVYGPLTAMIEPLGQYDFVVTPHALTPPPSPGRFWDHPTARDLTIAGQLNAGMFSMRRCHSSSRFVEQWREIVLAPGLLTEDGIDEQQAFNWVTVSTSSALVLRDPGYNLAYWNLHERLLGREEGRWTVEGRPLAAYHFSGFSPADPLVLSKWNRRHSTWTMPGIGLLCTEYAERVLANDQGELAQPYRFSRFPSGLKIEPEMRDLFKEQELSLRSDADPWTPEGETAYCRALLMPLAHASGFLPLLPHRLAGERNDVYAAIGDPQKHPLKWIDWFFRHGMYEHECQEIVNLYRPVLPSLHGATLLSNLHNHAREAFRGLRSPLRRDRPELIQRLEHHDPVGASELCYSNVEYWMCSSILAIRALVRERPDLLRSFPDLLFADAGGFVKWLREHRLKEHLLSPLVIDRFEQKARGGAMARIYAFFSTNWTLMERFPLGLVGEGSFHLRLALSRAMEHGSTFDLDDLVLFDWIMEVCPWNGIALTVELPVNASASPSSHTREGQDRLFRLLATADDRFLNALRTFQRTYRFFDPIETEGAETTAKSVRVLASPPAGSRSAKREIVPLRGVNLFGFHKSPTGLGELSRGARAALAAAGVACSPITVGGSSMDDDLMPSDFIGRFDPAYDTNLFVSYPHVENHLLRAQPRHFVAHRRNVVTLAWEQARGNPLWKRAYDEFDQVWAISTFSARALAEALDREVDVVPSVVDTTVFPAPASKRSFGLHEEAFTFLYVFDSNSSTERKNPEAAIEAFRRAFPGSEAVRLVIKGTDSRLEHRPRLRRLMTAAARDPRIELRLEWMSKAATLQLLSAADCYLSLHRAEGFGYTCAEAMAWGKPVIASGYSGNLEFMNDENSFLVRCSEVPVREPEGPFVRGTWWGEPDVDHAAELMRYVLEHPEAAARRGELGRATVLRDLSPSAIGERMKELLSK